VGSRAEGLGHLHGGRRQQGRHLRPRG
jgi:hypothetical protein